MKHYEKLLELRCFNKNDLEQITGSVSAAKWICREYQAKGYIERLKRDLYATISMETKQPVADRYTIASHISCDAIVSYHSAFEFYGYSNQVFYDVYTMTESRFRDFEYDGIFYRRVSPRVSHTTTEINGIRVTTLEQTVIDSINLFEKIGGLEELIRCIELIPSIDEIALAECLAKYENSFLYQKTGCILSVFAKDLGISEKFFEMCKTHLPKGKSYLCTERRDFVLNKEWRLYEPKNLINITNKGITNYAV